MNSIAIVGAGSSGLAAAHTLQDAGQSVTLFEQSQEVGGRAATRNRNGFIYDHGAQYIKGEGNGISTTFITERFRAPDLLNIAKPVWIFDRTGHIQEGDSLQNATPRWNYRSGLTALAKQMAQGLTIHFNTRITHIEQIASGWRLIDSNHRHVGDYKKILMAMPAPQVVEILQASQLAPSLQKSAINTLKSAGYNPLISVMLGYQPAPRSRPYYALVNTDKAHAISWLAWEHEKDAARVPTGCGLLIAQMAPHYSREHWEQADEQSLLNEVAQLVAALIDEALPSPIFTDIQYWRYALPITRADADALNRQTIPHGLAFCGDAFVGGRVHLALEHGVKVAQNLLYGV